MKTQRSQNTLHDIELGHAPLRNPSEPRSTDAIPAAPADTIVIQTRAARLKKRLLAAAAVGGTLLGGGLVAAVAVPLLQQQRNQARSARDAALAQLAHSRYAFSTPPARVESQLQQALAPAPGGWVPGDDSDTTANLQVTVGNSTQTLKQALFYRSGAGIDLIFSNHPNLCELMTTAGMSDFTFGPTVQTTLYRVAPFGAGFSWDAALLPVRQDLYTNTTNIVAPGNWTLASTVTDGVDGAVISRLGLQANVTSAFTQGATGHVQGTLTGSAVDGTQSAVSGSFKASRCVEIEDQISDEDAYEQSNMVAEALAEQAPARAPAKELGTR